jgi:hypothetical protein
MLPVKEEMVIILRNGVEIYIDKEKGLQFMKDRAEGTIDGFVILEGRGLNCADVTGVVFPSDMDDLARRRNGMWRCQQSEWHEKGTKCDCVDKNEKDRMKKMAEAIAKCGKCNNGTVFEGESARICECILPYVNSKE